MVITVKWQLAVIVPPTTHHFNGNGNIAYGTKMTNKMYHIKYSRYTKPTPWPTNPTKYGKRFNSIYICIILYLVGNIL